MREGDFRTYLLFVAAFAAILGIVNVMRPAKRWLGLGALALSVAAMMFAGRLPLWAVAIPGVVAVLCMARDVSARVGKVPREKA